MSSTLSHVSTPTGFRNHRRTSSQNNHTVYRETLDAKAQDLADGSRKLNQYVLSDEIGKGSSGSVSLAKDEVTGMEYVWRLGSRSFSPAVECAQIAFYFGL
jgi:hypothetical protein